MKNSFIKSTYGIDLLQFKEMERTQGGVCAICKKPESRKSRYGGTCRLHIDHDHKTGIVRGLLCSKCNILIGCAEDMVEILESAKHYLLDKNQNG